MEERLDASMHEKIGRYTPKQAIESDDNPGGKWKVVLHTIEVGARGCVHKKTVQNCFWSLGFSNSAISKIVRNLSLLVVRASMALYSARNSPCWDPLTSPQLVV